MTFATLLSAISLYPWNLGVNGYVTAGNYSNTSTYRSTSAYITLDKRQRTAFSLGYETFSIESEDSETWYQDNIYGRARLYIRPQLQIGLFGAGFLGGLNDERSGYSAGLQVEGDLKHFGYYAAWTNTGFSEKTAIMGSGRGRGRASSSVEFFQADMGLSRNLGEHRVFAGARMTRSEGDGEVMGIAGIRYRISSRLSLDLEHGFGANNTQIDPWRLTMDHNPETVNRTYLASLTGRLSPNFYLSASWVRKDYPATDDRWDYTAQFYTAGLRVVL